MQSILRDFVLSFCPAKVRQAWRPSSQLNVLRAAMWGGAAQFLLISLVLAVQFKHFFITRSQQVAPHMAGVNSTGEAVVTVLFALEFLFYPLSILLLYVALEGAVRFIGSFVTHEVVPSLLVFLFFKLSGSMSQSISRRRAGPPVADVLERLPDSRIRIASATPKSGWNYSVTIGIDGQWFEVEREDRSQPPRPYVYILRPAPPGKILRGYQEYPASTLETVAMKKPDASCT
ncbi:MAG TPA: hypothetical protein VLA83_05250 [Candidatus Binatia bacterium]|nr:hypothetical protein [Candidatus Binatia bacterium]